MKIRTFVKLITILNLVMVANASADTFSPDHIIDVELIDYLPVLNDDCTVVVVSN